MSYVLQFGKYSDQRISTVPKTYLKWLCTSDKDVTSMCMFNFIQSIENEAKREDMEWLSQLGVTLCDWADGHPLHISEQALWRRVYDYETRYVELLPDYVNSSGHKMLRQLLYLNVFYRSAVMEARKYRDEQKLCHLCMKKLVQIGYSRKNGANHADWSSRKYHKRCWRSLDN